jgi:hypothetical protein
VHGAEANADAHALRKHRGRRFEESPAKFRRHATIRDALERAMYGRARIELLRARMLPFEPVMRT